MQDFKMPFTPNYAVIAHGDWLNLPETTIAVFTNYANAELFLNHYIKNHVYQYVIQKIDCAGKIEIVVKHTRKSYTFQP